MRCARPLPVCCRPLADEEATLTPTLTLAVTLSVTLTLTLTLTLT